MKKSTYFTLGAILNFVCLTLLGYLVGRFFEPSFSIIEVVMVIISISFTFVLIGFIVRSKQLNEANKRHRELSKALNELDVEYMNLIEKNDHFSRVSSDQRKQIRSLRNSLQQKTIAFNRLSRRSKHRAEAAGQTIASYAVLCEQIKKAIITGKSKKFILQLIEIRETDLE